MTPDPLIEPDFYSQESDFYLDVLYGLVEEGCEVDEIVFELKKAPFGKARTEFKIREDVAEARKIIMK